VRAQAGLGETAVEQVWPVLDLLEFARLMIRTSRGRSATTKLAMARLAATQEQRNDLVDRANTIRPRTVR
jgi:hypothetical protein